MPLPLLPCPPSLGPVDSGVLFQCCLVEGPSASLGRGLVGWCPAADACTGTTWGGPCLKPPPTPEQVGHLGAGPLWGSGQRSKS